MIFQILTKEEAETLKNELEDDLPGSAKTYYILSNFLNGLLNGFEVIVDHWPSWTCIILRPQTIEAVPSYFRHYYICHTRSIKAFRFFIQRPCVVDWKKPVVFTGVPYDAVATVQEQCRKHGGQLSSVEHRFMYCWTKPDPPEQSPIPEDLVLDTLNPTDAPALCERWKHHRPDAALDLYMKEVSIRFDSSAIRTKSGQLVAYIGMQFNGAMAMLHVDPKHRGLGLGQIVLADLTRKLLAKGKTAYGFIPTNDTSFITTSSQKLGFTWIPQGSMSWVRYLPKSALALQQPSLQMSGVSSQFQSVSKDGAVSNVTESQQENGAVSLLYLTALPLSCNECADISNDTSSICSHIKVGIS